jgi:cell division protein FtsB
MSKDRERRLESEGYSLVENHESNLVRPMILLSQSSSIGLSSPHAAAEAIKKLVIDRRLLRDTVAAQERELARLRASNAELWRHVALIRDSYSRLAIEFFTQLQGIDSSVEAATPAEFRPGPQQAAVEDKNEDSI